MDLLSATTITSEGAVSQWSTAPSGSNLQSSTAVFIPALELYGTLLARDECTRALGAVDKGRLFPGFAHCQGVPGCTNDSRIESRKSG